MYTRCVCGFVSRGGEKAQKVALLVSLVPQLEIQCICYAGNGKSCGEYNVYMRCGGRLLSRGHVKVEKVVFLVSLVPQLVYHCL